MEISGYTFERMAVGSVVAAERTWEGFRLNTEIDKHRGTRRLVTAGVLANMPILDITWLKAAAEVYDVSADPKDYVFVEVPANNADLPNRNMDAFPYDELVKYRPILGRLAYKSYRGKMCIAEGTLIDTDVGLVPIEDVQKVGATKVVTTQGYRKLLRWIDNGSKDTILLRLENGSTLRGTKDHRIQVVAEDCSLVWKPLGDLTEGDYVVSLAGTPTGPKRKVSLPSCTSKDEWVERYEGQAKGGAMHAREVTSLPTEVTPELARILGYLVAEGSVTDKCVIEFSNKRDDLLEDYRNCWKACFSDNELSEGDKGDNNRTLVARSVILREWLSMIGLNFADSYQKVVPWCVLQSSPEIVTQFIRAYWDGDGCHGTCYSVSSKLLGGLQQCLRRLGILAKRQGKYLVLPSEEFVRFKQRIGTSREDREEEYQNLWSRTSAYGHIPFVGLALANLAQDRRRGHGGKTRYVDARGNQLHISFHVGHVGDLSVGESGLLLREEVIGLMAATYLLDPALAQRLEILINPNMRFLRVDSLSKPKERRVFDLEVEDAHQFVANGVVVHNCSQNHDNKDPLKAKGICFDSQMVKTGKFWHTKVIAGFCRQKDSRLANRILANKDAGYSMACLIGGASCSICGFFSQGNVTCRHINGGLGKGNVQNGQLIYDLCVWEETLVTTDHGFLPIRECKEGMRAWTQEGWKPISKVWHNGWAEVRSLVTEDGRKLRLTSDHKVYVVEDFKLKVRRFRDLKPGDWMVINGKGSWPTNERYEIEHSLAGQTIQLKKYSTDLPDQMTPDLAKVLGYLISEGSLRKERVNFCNKDHGVLQGWTDAVEGAFGQSRYVGYGASSVGVSSICGVQIVNYLSEGCGMELVKSGRKEVPASVLRSNEACVAAFLRGYWEGDGSTHPQGKNMSASSKSRRLLQQIQLLLDRWGIPSTIKKEPHSGVNSITMWKIWVNGQYARQLYQILFGADLPKFEEPDRKSRTLQDPIPGTAGLIRKIQQQHTTGTGRSARCYDAEGNAIPYAHFGFETQTDGKRYGIQLKGDLSQEQTRELLPHIQKFEPELAAKLQALLDSNCRFVRVTSIGKPITVKVMNLTVEDAHQMQVAGLQTRQCRDLNFWEMAHVEDRADIDAVKDWVKG
jgi:intein/homing endonuclease